MAATFEGDHNLRDLGGLPLAQGGATPPRRVLRGCAMTGLAPAGRAALLGYGVTTVIDLRNAAERQADPSPFAAAEGARVLPVPLFDGLAPLAVMAAGNPQFRLDTRYIAALAAAAPRFAEVFGAIASAGEGTLLFHCTAGKDRTGLVAALLLRLAGVPAAAVVEDYARTATFGAAHLGRLRRQALDSGRDPALVEIMLGSPAEAMAATLDTLETRHGGAAAYLSAAGLPAAHIDRAASRLRP